jgi:MFS family permease
MATYNSPLLHMLSACCSYVTFAIGVAGEVVALLLVGPTVDRLGRHNILAAGHLLGGAACVACALVSGGTSQAVLSGIGKLGSSGEPGYYFAVFLLCFKN